MQQKGVPGRRSTSIDGYTSIRAGASNKDVCARSTPFANHRPSNVDEVLHFSLMHKLNHIT